MQRGRKQKGRLRKVPGVWKTLFSDFDFVCTWQLQVIFAHGFSNKHCVKNTLRVGFLIIKVVMYSHNLDVNIVSVHLGSSYMHAILQLIDLMVTQKCHVPNQFCHSGADVNYDPLKRRLLQS